MRRLIILKSKYSVDEQLKNLEDKNVQFNIMSKEEAEYSANGRPLVTVEKSTQYAKQVHLTKKLNTVGSPF